MNKVIKDGTQRPLKGFSNDHYPFRLNVAEMDDDSIEELCALFGQRSPSKLLKDFLYYVNENSDLFQKDYMALLVDILKNRFQWVRHYTEWKSQAVIYENYPDHNEQMASLIQHLFSPKTIPDFFYHDFLNSSSKDLGEFVTFIKTHDLRRCPSASIVLSKRIIRFLYKFPYKVPSDYSVYEAYLWALVHGLGGDVRLFQFVKEADLESKEKGRSENEYWEFWKIVIRFFIDHPELDVSQFGPVADYIHTRKFVMAGPEKPNFSMRGRKPASLLREVTRWHEKLGQQFDYEGLEWGRIEISDFCYEEILSPGKKREWKISQLCTGNELIAEGNKLNHCVATYADSCMSGGCSIWSMTVETNCISSSHLTLEILNATKKIVQIRGAHNRLPTLEEMAIIKKWADDENLKIDSHLDLIT